MKIVLERSVLLKALDHLRNIVERRNTIPILSNILVEANATKLKLTATDIDMEASEVVEAVSDKAGATTLPAHLLHDIVRKLPDGSQVTIEVGEHTAAVKAGRSKFNLSTLPKEDFPPLSVGKMSHSFTMPASAPAKLIGAVRMSMSTEETRYYLNGFYLHDKDGKLCAVSTDGHRLTRYVTDLPDGAGRMPGIIVPRRASGEILRLLGDAEGDATFSLSDTKIELVFGNITVRSKLIDGNFPPYERVIPADNSNVLEVVARDLSAAIDRVSTVTSSRTAPVKLSMSGGTLSLATRNPEAGQADEDLAAEYAGTPMDIGFNGRYLREMLDEIETPNVRMLLADAGSPALIEAIGDTSVMYVLMPLRF